MFGYMKNVLFAMTVAVGFAGAGVAHAADCTGMAGYYLNNGACVECGLGTHYCPGDNTRQPCPDIKTHYNNTWPDNYYNPTIDIDRSRIYTEETNSTFHNYSDAKNCTMYHYLKNDYGDMYDIRNYNATTGRYDGQQLGILWNYMSANPGHYLTQPGTCGYYAYYRGAAVCPAGGYCPGKARVVCTSSNQATVHTATFGLEVCPNNTYSDAGATECTPCPYGLGNNGDDVASHAGIGSCQPIECPAGQYLGDDGHTCTLCDVGYYCPGDNARHYCGDGYTAYYADEPGLSACKPCPTAADEYMDGFSHYWYWIAENEPESLIHTRQSSCRAEWRHTMSNGSIMTFSCAYSTSGYTSQDENSTKCMAHSAACDAGYYVIAPGWGHNVSSWGGPSYKYMTETEFCQPVGFGYYSPAGSPLRTKCPDGTSTRTDTATGPDACESLCTFGGKKLHAGEHEFNIWPNGTCSSPSIGIGLPNGTCCVNLESGRGTGINVEWDGKIYHTVN